MLRFTLSVFLSSALVSLTCAQSVQFQDSIFESFLLNELAVDTNNDFSADLMVDANGNGQIELSEVLAVEHLEFRNNIQQYPIQLVVDLGHFSNLKGVTFYSVCSIRRIENIQLPNLEIFRFFDCAEIELIDLSELTALVDLRLESIDHIEELNLQNGHVADYQSLFYSEDIDYACVDSIAEEYNDVAWRMNSGEPMLNCTLGLKNHSKEQLTIFPNPSRGMVHFSSPPKQNQIAVTTLMGQTRLVPIEDGIIDLSHFPAGVYFLSLEDGGEFTRTRVVLTD